jgi:hypothetical protein
VARLPLRREEFRAAVWGTISTGSASSGNRLPLGPPRGLSSKPAGPSSSNLFFQAYKVCRLAPFFLVCSSPRQRFADKKKCLFLHGQGAGSGCVPRVGLFYCPSSRNSSTTTIRPCWHAGQPAISFFPAASAPAELVAISDRKGSSARGVTPYSSRKVKA